MRRVEADKIDVQRCCDALCDAITAGGFDECTVVVALSLMLEQAVEIGAPNA